ncbi:hypothetical protein SARC_13286 [Sphaeroforma arctica JP610]|uniref:Uncharacterized protein n=1 Tax=Sphaeroforma arctica JP610 TaxID=667725 RepID=A0A0L0FBM2_9EUKA|nr:hypothetical protein SARC_13286 [Sphaeroforma arctica JP610]KNC74157.1 hypothetical protein SARC_13286 [Sphaeroforma arctica JP610]|eukprot:XP_014148059.1 hypothetical protein SARC_13286 [Sphaeroforma arctica JP610]
MAMRQVGPSEYQAKKDEVQRHTTQELRRMSSRTDKYRVPSAASVRAFNAFTIRHTTDTGSPLLLGDGAFNTFTIHHTTDPGSPLLLGVGAFNPFTIRHTTDTGSPLLLGDGSFNAFTIRYTTDTGPPLLLGVGAFNAFTIRQQPLTKCLPRRTLRQLRTNVVTNTTDIDAASDDETMVGRTLNPAVAYYKTLNGHASP